jgi:hypothetical protein
MRPYREPTVEELIQQSRDTAFEQVYQMNRKERRTAKGRQIVAEAEAEALRKENEILRAELELRG